MVFHAYLARKEIDEWTKLIRPHHNVHTCSLLALFLDVKRWVFGCSSTEFIVLERSCCSTLFLPPSSFPCDLKRCGAPPLSLSQLLKYYVHHSRRVSAHGIFPPGRWWAAVETLAVEQSRMWRWKEVAGIAGRRQHLCCFSALLYLSPVHIPYMSCNA